MIKNYLTIAFRNLWKHKFFTGLNVIGLSLSMSVCLVLIQLVYEHYQYDQFHENGDNTYRVTTFRRGSDGPFDDVYATSSLPINQHLKDNYAFIQSGTNMNNNFRGEIRSPFKILDIEALYADQDFFNVFGFELKYGNPDALANPFSIVLSEDFAAKLFPDMNPVGQTVDFEDHGNYVVTGVVAKPPGNSHIQFEALASFSTMDVLVNKEIFTDRHTRWENVWDNYNYFVLTKGTDRAEVEQIINEVAESNLDLADDHPGWVYRLQAMDEIVPGRVMSNEISFALPWFVLVLFGFLGFVVLITATINYTNLSIAKSLSRAKEIGVRKVNGASKRQIVFQFLVESVLTSIVSLVVAFVIYKFLVQSFNEIWIFSQVGIVLSDSVSAYGYFLAFTILLGILTGIGPALFLSRLKAVNSLKGSLGKKVGKRRSFLSYLTGKRTLLSIQFSLSILMLVTILVLMKQANFLVNADYGFNESEIFYVKTHGHDPQAIAQKFSSVHGVKNVTFTSHHPATGRSQGTSTRISEEQEPIVVYHFGVSPTYVDVMGLELIAGSDFPEDLTGENEKFIILNEQAVETYGFTSAGEAVGETVRLIHDSVGVVINGVVKDFHWEPLMNSIRPLGLRIMPDSYEYAYLEVSSEDLVYTTKRMEEAWIEFDTAREFEGGFLDAELDRFYQYFYDLGSILAYVAILALSITGLGFLGIVSFELKLKIKEIGIRKVLGATFGSLTLTMSRGFIVMLIITSIVALPFSIWVNGLWVNNMAFHADMGITVILPALFIVSVIAGSAIISQVWINANKNPTETLRNE